MRNNPTMMITDVVSSYSELHNFVIFFSKIQEVYHMVKKVSSKTQYQFLAIYIKKINISGGVDTDVQRCCQIRIQSLRYFDSYYKLSIVFITSWTTYPFYLFLILAFFNEIMYSWYPHVLLLFFNRKLIALWDWLVVELTVPTRLVAKLIRPLFCLITKYYFWYSC